MSAPLFGRVLHRTIAPVVRCLFRMRVIGLENVPDSGAILTMNHRSYADPVLAWAATPRHSSYMAKAELWGGVFLRATLPGLGTIPVHRGEADRGALTAATDLVRRGELLGIFPEGTRHHDGAGQARGGAAFIAMRSGVPIIPVGIDGSERIRPEGVRLFRLPRVRVSLGRPIQPADFAEGGRKERVTALTDEVIRCIYEEVERAKEA